MRSTPPSSRKAETYFFIYHLYHSFPTFGRSVVFTAVRIVTPAIGSNAELRDCTRIRQKKLALEHIFHFNLVIWESGDDWFFLKVVSRKEMTIYDARNWQ